MIVTYEQKDVQSSKLHHGVCHEKENPLIGKFICVVAFLNAKVKSVKKIYCIWLFWCDVNKCP